MEKMDKNYPRNKTPPPISHDLKESDRFLKEQTAMIRGVRKDSGLEGLVGGLDSIVINTELDKQRHAVKEILTYTGYELKNCFETKEKRFCKILLDFVTYLSKMVLISGDV